MDRHTRGGQKKLGGENSPPGTNTFPGGQPACSPKEAAQCTDITRSAQPPPTLRVILPADAQCLEPENLDPWLDSAYPESVPNFAVKGGEAEGEWEKETKLDLGSLPRWEGGLRVAIPISPKPLPSASAFS